jgi:cytoskeletal protein RodZ
MARDVKIILGLGFVALTILLVLMVNNREPATPKERGVVLEMRQEMPARPASPQPSSVRPVAPAPVAAPVVATSTQPQTPSATASAPASVLAPPAGQPTAVQVRVETPRQAGRACWTSPIRAGQNGSRKPSCRSAWYSSAEGFRWSARAAQDLRGEGKRHPLESFTEVLRRP